MAAAVIPARVLVTTPVSALGGDEYPEVIVQPTRLTGALGNGVNIGQNASASERIDVGGMKTLIVHVRTAGPTFQGTLSIDLYGMSQEATAESNTPGDEADIDWVDVFGVLL